MGEMSLAELKERLTLTRNTRLTEQEEKRRQILEEKKKRKQLLQKRLETIELLSKVQTKCAANKSGQCLALN